MKTITVVDSAGNLYESTYPKRAKGLIKKGRARFVNECTICLTCPPKREEFWMTQEKTSTPTAAEIFAELKQIREDTSHITLAMEKLEKVPVDSSEQGACQDKIAAILAIAEAREKTNQDLIRLYEKMYESTLPQEAEDESI